MNTNQLFQLKKVNNLIFGLISLLLAPIVSATDLNEPILPVVADTTLNPAKIALGKRLFHDKRLSKDNSVSCATCHGVETGGADHREVSLGTGGAEGSINAPTVLNSSFNFRQFWDGRAASLEEQIDGPIHDEKEMNTTWPEVIAKLEKDESYRQLFIQLYPDGLQASNIKNAIADYERSLVTPSRFDKYLQGEKTALNDYEIKGYELFKSYGCIACHQGANVGGNMYQKFGVIGNYFTDRGNVTEADLGRYNVTGKERDRHKFKVPSLRNVELTAPYFHDGSAKTLEEAVDVMAKYQLGREIPEGDQALIIKFLNSLTGQLDNQKVAENKK